MSKGKDTQADSRTIYMVFSIVSAILLALTSLYWVTWMDVEEGKKYTSLTDSEIELRDLLKTHVYTLGSEIGERNMWKICAMTAASDYIQNVWEKQGHTVLEQKYRLNKDTALNLEIELTGQMEPETIVLIGAHYDSARGSPGANDNGSGIAALLELSRLARKKTYAKTLRFVAFANEEPPFFLSAKMGSRVYAKRARKRKEDIQGMISLETIGYYSDAKKSQKYPFPLSFFYPDTGNFIGFVGNLRSRKLVQNSLESFRKNTSFPAHGVSAPGWLTGIGWSDQWSFWQEGYKAIMVTDTAPFRYEYYHTWADTPDKLTYDHMTKVVTGLSLVIDDLAGRM